MDEIGNTSEMLTDDFILGGQVMEDRGQCSGLLTVCCHQRGRGRRARSRHHHHPSLAELVRVPRQLSQELRGRQVGDNNVY